MMPPPKAATTAATRFRLLAFATVGVTWGLIVVGGIVRVTGSGMACPDWPKCNGHWIPPFSVPVYLEYIHRVMVVLVTPLILGTAGMAWRRRAVQPGAFVPALAAVGLLVVQIGLGALTVHQSNSAASVVAHLMTALSILGCLTVVAARALVVGGSDSNSPATRSLPPGRGWFLVGMTLLAALAGSLTQTTGGGFACPSFPLCLGQVWPSALGRPAEWHMLHRALAVAIGIGLWLVARPAWQSGIRARRIAAGLAFGLYLLQCGVGIAQVLLAMPMALRALHLALGSAMWAAAVMLAALQRRPSYLARPADSAQARDRRAWIDPIRP